MRVALFTCTLAAGFLCTLAALVFQVAPIPTAPVQPIPQASATIASPSIPIAVSTPSVTEESPAASQTAALPPPEPDSEIALAGVRSDTVLSNAVPALSNATPVAVTLSPEPALEAAILDDLNNTRLEHGLAAVTRYDYLDAVALARTESLAAYGYFDHYAPDGGSAFSELATRGILYRLAGENLARNNYPANQTVDAAFQGLMASPGHRQNMLEPAFGAVGLAVTRWDGMWLYVIIFTNPR